MKYDCARLAAKFGLVFFGASMVLVACAAVPKTFDGQFARGEIAVFLANDFSENQDAAAKALRPTYKKYGAPHAYISGHMSSVNDPALSRLYGSGLVRSKLRQDNHTFWQVDGAALTGHLKPIQTAHLVYDTDRVDDLTQVLDAVGSLSKSGKIFTVFEREVDGQIVVTVHRTDDLPKAAKLDALTFFE